MSYTPSNEFLIEVAKGNIPGHSLIHKFGHNEAVGTTFAPVTQGGVYPTPQVGSETTLRIKAGGNANDTAAGTGGREITLEGLDETGAFATATLATAGVLASSATSITFLRLFRAFVSASGTYATATVGSHAADIVIEDSGGTEDWATINLNSFPAAQTEIGVFSVPLGFTAHMLSASVFSDSTKITELSFFQRQNILETAAPFTAMRLVFDALLEGGNSPINPKSPIGPFPALTDIGFMANVDVSTASVNVDIEILQVAD